MAVPVRGGMEACVALSVDAVGPGDVFAST